MTISITSPVTGAAQGGLTSPTYTVTPDASTSLNSKLWVVTTLGGTQAGVRIHSPSDPFSIAAFRPNVFKRAITAIAGLASPKQPQNTTGFTVRKGLLASASATPQEGTVRVTIDVPAGSETYDAANVSAMISAAFGYATQQSSNLGDTVKTGVMG